MIPFMFTKIYFLSKKSAILLIGIVAFICLPFCVSAQKKTVTGIVTATDGSPLVGATVLEKGTANGTQTNGNGNFTISVGDNAVLSVSSVGYQDATVSVNGQTQINISLKPSVNTLEQVVVVGYGTQRKIDVTGSVANIKGEVISKQSSYNPLSALQGQVAGVQVANSGSPGAPPKLTIRGVGTVYGNTDPLYVVDGVWYNDVSFLNSSDIESVSVLKDASSESIYGIRAANGVVLITTKKGRRNGKSVINYNGFAGNQVITNQIKMATGPEYAQMINEVYALNGSPALYPDPSSFGTTDWYHLILRNAFVTNNQISVNGGGEKSTYNFSLGYYHQDGLVKKNDFNKYSVHVSNDYQVTDFLKVGVNTTGILSNSNDAPGGIFYALFNAAPIVPAFYADGSYGDPADYNIASSNQKNPQENIDYFNNTTKTWKLNGNVYADVKFLKNFTFHSSLGGDFEQSEGKGYTAFTNYNYIPVALRNTHSVLSVGRSETRNWILENTLTFDKRIGDHSLKVLLGQGAQEYKSYFLNGSVQDVPPGTSTEYIALGNSSTATVSDGGSLDRVSSYFGRVNYSYQDKYLFTGSLRADGSSKFSNTWGYFPSVGIGWVISKEKFFENQHLFNNLKLRGSWGRVGNLSVPANLSILTASQTPALVYVGGDGSSAPGASINTVVPPATKWEVGEGTDVGLDAALINNKLNIELDWYNKKTNNAIFAIPVLGSVGTVSGTIIGNQATFQNQGFEFLATWKDDINKDWHYSISANGGFNQNKVLQVSSGGNPIYDFLGANVITRTMVGQPIGEFFGRQVIGIFQSAADIASYTNKSGLVIQPVAKPGDFKYKDENGDGVIDDKDRVPLGNPNPKFIYGLNTTLSYKRFDLTLDFQGVSGVSIYNGNFALRFGGENYTQDFYDNRWHGEGTSNVYPSVNVAGNNSITNSFFVEDGSYFRIRNAQLGYTVIASGQHSLFSNLRVYVNAQNPFTWFSYRGFTPEVQASSPTKAGIDQQVYPLYATYNFGVNLTF
jgi:TonB-linked SusC/RagA family outer membrane protein